MAVDDLVVREHGDAFGIFEGNTFIMPLQKVTIDAIAAKLVLKRVDISLISFEDRQGSAIAILYDGEEFNFFDESASSIIYKFIDNPPAVSQAKKPTASKSKSKSRKSK